MEFMLSEALPIYSGGLGNVAGDQLKSASDLGVPVVGVGLLYQQGYFRQLIDRAGGQQALFPYNRRTSCPLLRCARPAGSGCVCGSICPEFPVWLRTWQAQVGRTRLLLLDSNDPANFPAWRGITNELYGGGPEQRLRQEMILGIGGWRLLGALGIEPQVCHLNEGHAAFAVLERASAYMQRDGTGFRDGARHHARRQPVHDAHGRCGGLRPLRPGAHRAVPGPLRKGPLGDHHRTVAGAGSRQPAGLVRELQHGVPRDPRQWRGQRRQPPARARSAGRFSARLFPRWAEEEVPVGHITNGVHMPTWDSRQAEDLWTRCRRPGLLAVIGWRCRGGHTPGQRRGSVAFPQ